MPELTTDIELLREMLPEELERIRAITDIRSYAPNAVVVRQGTAPEAVFVVLEGTVRVTAPGLLTKDGIKDVLRWLKENRGIELPAKDFLLQTVRKVVSDRAITREETDLPNQQLDYAEKQKRRISGKWEIFIGKNPNRSETGFRRLPLRPDRAVARGQRLMQIDEQIIVVESVHFCSPRTTIDP